MADLTSEQKELIVVRLACYAEPTEIQAEFKDKYDFKPTLSQLSYYNPMGAQGSRELKQEWKDLFWAARAEHDATVLKKMPFTNQDYRMMLVQRVVSDPVLGRSKTGAKFYEMGCKDLGGMYVRPSEDKEGGDPNAIPQSLEDAVKKVYGEPHAAQPDHAGSGDANRPGDQHGPRSGPQTG